MSRVTPTTPITPTTSATPTTPTTSATPPSDPPESHYPIKWVFNESQVPTPIILQSSNGPCALLALVNTLLLTHHLTLPPGTTTLPESHIMSLLANHASSQPHPSENHAHLLQEFLELLPSLSAGLHINVRFRDATSFEFTKELSAFDVLRVRLLHGWLVDPQDGPLTAALAHLSYNQVLNELVRTASPAAEHPSAPPLEAFDGDAPLVAESSETGSIRELRPCVLDFFEGNPTMLTVYGLAVLHDVVREAETAVLFRNSHFYVLRKRNGELYTLVTDVGFVDELNTVWEKLIDVTGDSVFYTGAFDRIAEDGRVVGATFAQTKGTRVGASTAGAGAGAGASASASASASARAGARASAPPGRVGVQTSVHGNAVPVGVRRSSAFRKNSEKCVIQ